METSGSIDIFATKGMEYIFILCFIVALIFFWRFLVRVEGTDRSGASRGLPNELPSRRFQFPRSLYYHKGHGWVQIIQSDVVRIGVNDFVQMLAGRLLHVELPPAGTRLKQGERGWKLQGDSDTIYIPAPVDGEVLAINGKVLRNPQTVNRDPYDNGWLLKVRVPDMKRNLVHLLSGEHAAAWTSEIVEAFYRENAENPELSLKTDQAPADEIRDAMFQSRLK